MEHSNDSQTVGTIPVQLNVYDVATAAAEGNSPAIVRLNNITRELGFGGVFHGAIIVGGSREFSFGYCERGTGVYACEAGRNPMYTFRETIKLGETTKSKHEVGSAEVVPASIPLDAL